MKNKKGAWVADVKREKELKTELDDGVKSKVNDEVMSQVKQFFAGPDPTKSPPFANVAASTGSESTSGSSAKPAVTFDHVKGLLAKLSG